MATSALVAVVFLVGLYPANLASGQASNTIRLVDGSNDLKGRVEVLVGGVWGTVCDDDWDLNDARVVCHQLGYSRALSAPGSAQFGRGTIPIVLDHVNCKGSEKQLQDCPASRGNNCNHGEDAGVVCASASAGDIRLIGGSSALEGRVEVFVNGAWGTVCDDGWDLTDASVACRQLGYNHALSALGSAHFGQGTGAIVLDGVECTGRESRLQDCTSASYHNCDHGEDAGIVCSEQNEIQLVGGSSALEGRVEVKFGNLWGTICDDDWDLADATVVCRQLGYGEALSAPGGATFGEGTGSIAMNEVDCKGTEDSVKDCGYTSSVQQNCYHSEDAGVSCSGMRSAYEFGQVRLVDGSSEYEGYVEVYYNQQWGTVCNDGWDQDDADVVCEELGFDFAISTSKDSDYDRSASGPIWLSYVHCEGTENRLADCSHGKWDDNYCSHAKDVRVKCNGAPKPLSTGAIIALSCGAVAGLILLCTCYTCCHASKNTTTATPAASRTTYSQVAANEANTATPVIHYHPAQQSVSVAPSMPAQPSAPTLQANEAPPPSYQTVVAQPTMFPVVPTTGQDYETIQQAGRNDPAYSPATPPPAYNPEPSNLGTNEPRTAFQTHMMSNPT
ncbi:deleted in malignant brain tumors 1 protein-like [Acanthaster planci]|uniref:Deleted in malignant brain tumors 1 protein-like n=1 Tax=Acanthaster planci TaxID=133434 RepID=A0A8B7YFQ4_ACAPL|nr:deleted in malignant brain tumors 1 protein-like [Acanthaster planci]